MIQLKADWAADLPWTPAPETTSRDRLYAIGDGPVNSAWAADAVLEGLQWRAGFDAVYDPSFDLERKAREKRRRQTEANSIERYEQRQRAKREYEEDLYQTGVSWSMRRVEEQKEERRQAALLREAREEEERLADAAHYRRVRRIPQQIAKRLGGGKHNSIAIIRCALRIGWRWAAIDEIVDALLILWPTADRRGLTNICGEVAAEMLDEQN